MTTQALPRLVVLEEAAKELNLPPDILRQHIASGTIKAYRFRQNGDELILVPIEMAVIQMPVQRREDHPLYKQVAHLRGKPIHVSAAARKYHIPHGTLSRWAKKGIVRKLGKEKNRTLLDEADVAFCALVYHQRGGQGKWLFDPTTGLPYNPKRRRANE